MVAYLARRRARSAARRSRPGAAVTHGVFLGVANGWLGPAGGCATAEDIEAHLDDIEDVSHYTRPGSAWDELRDIGDAHARRNATSD